ncbi:MAG TPA: hypothetical protein IAB30_01610 [Candidatus Fimenecus excrementavium]|nr:hypothetical protein [Candidatus Fimenecus excrementavium]
MEVQVLLSAPNQKESLWRLFLILQVILRGLEPGKVSAFGKCAGGTFSAGSARAVPHAQRGVSRAESLQGEAAADGQVLLSAPNQKESLWRLFLILQVILRGLEPGRFRRLENVPAAHFQPEARGRYRTQSVGCPERIVCEAKPPQTVKSSYPHQKTVHTFVWAVFCKNGLTFICYFFHNFSFLLLQNGF